MSEGERAKPRRRRGGRRSRRAAGPPPPSTAAPTPATAAEDLSPPSVPAKEPGPSNPDSETTATGTGASGRRRPTRRPGPRLRTVHETSAGGLVVDGIDRPREEQLAALIGRLDRRGRMLWSLPKGHIEQGETAEQTAMREVAEETGIHGDVLAALGRIDYWFVTDGRRVHKTVHHYLLQFRGGELCDEDVEVTEVAWVPVAELPHRLSYADERRLARVAHELIELLQSDGPAALPPLPPSSPRVRPQTHSHTRNRPSPDAAAGPPRRRANGGGPGS
ncbi:MAG TPA: NUDIX hydrolase [Mycobacterium sp.]|nr:NUDIX hydrolase [Mycobacterium sp.]